MTSLKPRGARKENRVQVDLFDENGESVKIDIPKAEFQTRKRMKDLQQWIKDNSDSSVEDMMVHIIGTFSPEAEEFINEHEIEVSQLNELWEMYTDKKGEASEGE